MIDELKNNVRTEIGILREISNYTRSLEYVSEHEKSLLIGSIVSLEKTIKIINASIPKLLKDIEITKKLPSDSAKPRSARFSFERIKFKRSDRSLEVVLDRRDKEKFLRELSIGENLLRKIKKKRREEKEVYTEFKVGRGYFKLANKFFFDRADILIKKGYFKNLSVELKKSNLDLLLESYVAVILLSSFLTLVLSIFAVVFFFFFDFAPGFPFFEFFNGSYLLRFAKIFWIPFVSPVLVFLILYVYPSTEKKSLQRRIDIELPFAVIHMSAISGSGIEPSEIFRIIGLNREYPYLRKEIRKVLNQINLYGYDLITALNNASISTPSEKLSELFSGLSTTITSGASLPEFFEKRAETLLLNYRLDREKYTKTAETFLDIYISLVIAAPMVFLLLFIMIMLAGFNVGLSSLQLSLLVILGVALLNILFLILLHLRQPTY
ncbi:MAG: type II secretion system F family protein [Nanoarchaeota archaeon]